MLTWRRTQRRGLKRDGNHKQRRSWMVKRNRAAGERREQLLRPKDTLTRETSQRDRQSLTQKLTKQGKIRLTNDLQLLRARKAFVVDLLPLAKVAEDLGLERSTLQRWAHLYNWYDDRSDRELALYRKVAGLRRNLVPDIDQRHDSIFSSLEDLLETTVRELSDAGVAVPPQHLRTLASTAEICQKSRRVVHKKEQSISKKVLEIQEDPKVYDDFIRSLTDLASGDSERALTAPQKERIQDAEFDELEDDDGEEG